MFSSSILYPLPFGRGQRFDGKASLPMDWLIGGWQTSLIALVQSGTPVDLSTGQNQPGNRPDLIGSIGYPKSITGHWFNPSAFLPTFPPSRPGRHHGLHTPGNSWPQPGLRAGLSHGQFQLPEESSPGRGIHAGTAWRRIQSAQLGGIHQSELQCNRGNFGQVEGTQVYSNREIQLAARFTF